MEESRGLSCSVCYNAFTSVEDQSVPRNLNCGHTFCTACLQKIAAQSLYVYVKCPACKTETPLLASGRTMRNNISSLPKNFGLLEIIESKEKNPDNASTCGKAGIDEDKCNNNVCKEHDEAKKVYCFTDQCLICIYCQIYGKHQGHNCELASTLAKNSREELQKISEKLESECDMLCKATSEISDMENLIINRQCYLRNRVKKYMILLHHNLSRQEGQIISQINELTTSKLKVLEKQEKTLSEVISKCKELHLLIRTVQNDSDNCVIVDKPNIEKLVDEMSYLAEACQTQPQAENNLMFEFNKDVLDILKKLSGEIVELEADEEQNDGSVDSKQHLLDNALSNLEKEIRVCDNRSNRASEQEDTSAEHVDTESEEEDEEDDDGDDGDDDDDDEDEGEESEVMISTSEADEAEQEEAENRDDMSEANADQAEDEEVASEGELVGAVGGNALPEAQQDENKRKDINEKQSLLRELQHEIERLRLLGPTGEVIRVIDDSSSSSFESGTDTDDEHDTHSLQLDFQIRVNNDLGRAKSRATGGTAVQEILPNKDVSVRDRRKHGNLHSNPRTCGKKRCSVANCQHHVHPSLQCKNCCHVFCRRCALLSLTCNKSDCGHSYVSYRHGNHHHSKNIKSRFGKNSVSKLQKTCKRGSIEEAPHWVCKRCTMLNEGHVLVCGACETSKDYDPEGTRNVCPMCTLVNEPGKTSCELCDTDLEERE